VIAYVGGFTALMSATIALTQWDIKRVLAYSTISQLGYMVMALGVGAYSAGFLHLMTHAFFKACLFLGSGSVIHAMHHVYHKVHDHHRDPQDMRNMGGLRARMPLTYWTFLIATLALAGVPLTSGFISKDAILAGSLAFAMKHPQHWPLAVFGFAAAMLTAFYMFRLVFLTFHGEHKGREGELAHAHESPLNMTGPLLVLSVLSVFFFYSPNPTNAGAGWFYRLIPRQEQPILVAQVAPAQQAETWLASRELAAAAADSVAASAESHRSYETYRTYRTYGDPTAESEHDAHIEHLAHNRAMLLSVLIVAFSITMAWLTYLKRRISADRVAAALPGTHRFLFNKWFFDELYHATVVALTLAVARLCAWFDRRVIDGIVDGSAHVTTWKSRLVGRFDNGVVDGAVNGVGWLARVSGAGLRLVQGGDIQGYLVKALVGVLLLLVWQVL
jgi:NADH-quinone oxidoreductase subunit L